ncbi:MAG: glycosyltransferase family 39 protein [Acidobacteriaceae bacterium]
MSTTIAQSDLLAAGVQPTLHHHSHDRFLRPRWQWAWVIAIWLVVYFAALFTPALLDDADGTHAQAARWMIEHHDFVTLHVDGVRYLEKAPLPYWLSAAGYKIFGFNAFATHLPLALATLLTALLALFWGRRAYGGRVGFYAALMVLTAVGEFLFTRYLIPEVIISLLLSAALYCFARAMSRSGEGTAKFWYAIYALMALAVLAKGLIGVVFFVGPAFLYLAITGEWRRWREFRMLRGALLFFAIAAPWHVLAGLRSPGFYWFYFYNEHYLRFIGQRIPKDYNKLPWYLYWSLHLVWLFPWSLFLPLAVIKVWHKFKSLHHHRFRQLDFKSRTTLLCALQAITVLVFFAVSTNQEYYTFPAYFPILLITAYSLAEAEWVKRRFARRSINSAYLVLLAVGAAISCSLIAGLWSSRHLPYISDVGTAMVQRGVGNYTLSMSQFFDLTGSAFAGLRLPALLAALAFLIGPIAGFTLRLRKRPLAATLAVALTATGFFVAAHLALDRFEPFLTSIQLARAFNATAKPSDPLLVYGDQSHASSLIFYSGRQALLVNGKSTSLLWGSHYPDAPHIFLDDQDLVTRWRGAQRIFLFVDQDDHDKVVALLGGAPRVIAESSGKELLSNQ